MARKTTSKKLKASASRGITPRMFFASLGLPNIPTIEFDVGVDVQPGPAVTDWGNLTRGVHTFSGQIFPPAHLIGSPPLDPAGLRWTITVTVCNTSTSGTLPAPVNPAIGTSVTPAAGSWSASLNLSALALGTYVLVLTADITFDGGMTQVGASKRFTLTS